MKRLLLPLLAALALPTSVNAETWWLMAVGRKNAYATANWSIPTSSLAECEAAGQKFKEHEWKWRNNIILERRDYVCVKGK